MDDRARALAEFDRQHGIPEIVSIKAVEIEFWNLVNLFIKILFAWAVAVAIVGAIIGIPVFVLLLLIGR